MPYANNNRTVAIIPNYNGRHFLAPCIDALMSQQPCAPDIIVVDNCSKDGSAAFLRENYPSVRVMEMDRNAGFGAAVNLGIRESACEFVALVNNDAVVQPWWLAALQRALDERPAAGAVAPKVIFHTADGIIDSAGDCCTPYGFAYKRGHFERDTGQYDAPAEIFAVSAVATLFRRAMFDSIGLFDENFFAYYEDLDLCFRGRLAGWTFWCEPSAVALHHYSATSGSRMKLGSEEVYIHLTGIWLKDVPGAIILRKLPSVIIFHSLIFAGVLLARLRKRSKLPPVPLARFLSAMLRARPGVQRSRKIEISELRRMMARESVWYAIGTRLLKSMGKNK